MALKNNLRKTQEFSESIINTIREPLIILDQNLRVVTASRSFYEFFKVKPEETVGQLIYDLGNKQWDIPKLRELLETILPEKATFNDYEVQHDFATIGKHIMLLNARQIQRALGKERIILLAIEDITERKRIENIGRLATVVRDSNDAITIQDVEGKITAWNHGAELMFGYSEQEALQMTVWQLAPPDKAAEQKDFNRRLFASEKISSFETQRLTKDGRLLDVWLTVTKLVDDTGKVTGIAATERDITERKRLENLLKESETQYRLLFETANDGILLLEKKEGKIAHINPSVEKMLGYSARESIGNKLQDVGLIIDNGDFQITMKELNDRGILRYDDVPVKTKSGQHIYADAYLVDKAKFAQCNIRDITERKKAEEILKESENKYRMLADNIHDVIFVLDMNMKYTYVSPSVKILRGYEPEEVMKLSIIETLTPSSMDFAIETLSDVMEKEKIKERELSESLTIPLEMKRKDGTTVWTEVKLSFIRDENQQAVGILGVTRDITERKHAEHVLRDNEARLNLALETNHTGVWELNLLDHTAFRTLIHDRIFGYETLLPNWTYEMFLEHVLPEDRPEVDRRFCEAIAAHSDWSFECRIHRADGEVRWILAKGQHVKTSKGEPVQMLGIVQDITERKQANEELLLTIENLRKSFGTTVQVMVSAVEMKDPYTAGHQLRSADLACAIATEMGLPQDKIEGLRMAGSIHDIGKLSIPSEILSKPTKLTNTEFSLIKEHAQNGYEMMKDVETPWPLAQIVYQHHERMNGSGYPRNLKGDEILLEARIMAVADVVEAMASHRPYRAALGIDAALEEIEKNKGIFYDVTVADACLRLFREKGYKLAA